MHHKVGQFRVQPPVELFTCFLSLSHQIHEELGNTMDCQLVNALKCFVAERSGQKVNWLRAE